MIGMNRTMLPVKRLNGYQLAPNEAVSTGAVNRVLEHLLKNDDLLREKLAEGEFRHAIVAWSRSSVYNPGDLVCYIACRKDGVPAAYILLCVSGTRTEPTAVLRNDLTALADSGWRLVHETTTYLIDSGLLRSDVLVPAAETAVLMHEKDAETHDSTVVSSIGDFSKLFLKNDLSNYMSKRLKRDDGTDSGAFAESARFASGHDSSAKSYSCTVSDGVAEIEMSFAFDATANQDVEILNPRYFLEGNPVRDKSDAHVFGSYYAEDTKSLTLENGITYHNVRIPGTNVFSRTISFDKPFRDSSYMIFQSSYLPNQFVFAQTASELVSKKTGNNAMFVGGIMFVNKTSSSVTAILPVHSHFSSHGQYSVGVPWVNEFRISVVGVLA